MTLLTTWLSTLLVQGKHRTGRREEDLIPCPILKMYSTEAIRMLGALHTLPGLAGGEGKRFWQWLPGRMGEMMFYVVQGYILAGKRIARRELSDCTHSPTCPFELPQGKREWLEILQKSKVPDQIYLTSELSPSFKRHQYTLRERIIRLQRPRDKTRWMFGGA